MCLLWLKKIYGVANLAASIVTGLCEKDRSQKTAMTAKVLRMLKELLALAVVADFKTAWTFYAAILLNLSAILRDKNLAAPHSKMDGRKCVFRVFGERIVLDGKTFGYVGEIYARQCYFPTSRHRITKDMAVVDLGAANGVFTVLAARLGRRVLAMDIDAERLAELERAVQENHCVDKVEVVRGAVGYRSGINIGDPAIPRFELGEVLRTHGFERVDFLKVDIEGSEFDLFRRDNAWLSKVRRIAMEVHTNCGDPDEIKDILESKGFRVTLRDVSGRLVAKITDSASGYIFAEAGAGT